MTDVDFLWNIAQHNQIRTAERHSSDAHEMARRTASTLLELQVTLERLSLTCRAMWELLRERTDVSEDELIAKVHELDLRDGHPDGRLRNAVKHCAKCARVNNARRERCLYCGNELDSDSAFNAI